MKYDTSVSDAPLKFEMPVFDERPAEFAWFFQGTRGKVFTGFLVAYFLFHIAFAAGWLATDLFFLRTDQFAPISIALTFVLVFMLSPAKKGAARRGLAWYDWLFMGGGVAGCIWILTHQKVFLARLPIDDTAVIIGTIFIIATLEALRRSMGLAVVVIMLAFFFYAMFSNIFPGIFWSTGFPYKEMIAYNFAYSGDGMFGRIGELFAKLMVMFTLFAATIQVSGAGKAILRVALGLLGHLKGGPAKVAVIASGAFGSISPGGPSNVMVTGCVTIPMMKKTGQTAEFAGSVEAVASTMGSVTPPVMGSIAFIVAEWLQMPFYMVMFAAFIPALLFYFCLFWMVDFNARVKNIPTFAKHELPSAWEGVKQGWHYVIPIAIFVYLIAIAHYSPQASITFGWFALLIVGQIRKEDRITWVKLQSAIQLALKLLVMLMPILIGIGLVLGSLTLTGMTIRFTGFLTDLAGGNLLILIVLAGAAAFIMGSGMPALAIYFILASLIAPALIKAGVIPVAAHLFIIYAMTTHHFTPPVMPVTIFASSIAGSKVLPTAWSAMRLAIALFIVPVVFLFNQPIMLQGGYSAGDILARFVPMLIGVMCLAGGIQGWFTARANWIQRILLMVSGIMLIVTFSNLILGIIGAAILMVILVWQGITPMWIIRKMHSLV